MRFGVLRSTLAAASFGAMLCAAQPVLAGAVSRDDFSIPKQGEFKVVVFRPDVHVGSLKLGGINEPNADWTDAARSNLQSALEASPEFADSKITFLDEQAGDNAKLLNDYRGLFETVAGAMFTHVTTGANILPTKKYAVPPKGGTFDKTAKKRSKIDWSLGEGAAQLKQITGSDYAMFVYTNDAYGDSGRKAAQALGMLGCLIGACVIIQAGVHVGYAGLVDLNTGNVVWFNTDLAMGGDVRDGEGANKRVGQLLAGFPKREGETGDAKGKAN